MRRQIILILTLVGALLAIPAVAQAHPALEPRIDALESAVADLQNRVSALESKGVYTKAQTFWIPSGWSTSELTCNSGDEASGGGWRDHSESSAVEIEADGPAQANFGSNNGWSIRARNTTSVDQKIDVHVVCLD